MIDWFKKHRVLFALICVVILLLLMGVPFVINILFKINATTDILVAEWSAGDALGYYGAILSFLGTVVLGALALYQNHIIKTEADKKAALAEEQERAENMPRFFLRFQCASGFCGSLKFAVMNVSNNIAYTIDVYDIKIKGGSKTIWESDDTYGAPVINPQKEMTIQTKSPATNETGEFTLFATMSCMDKYDGKHEYILTADIVIEGFSDHLVAVADGKVVYDFPLVIQRIQFFILISGQPVIEPDFHNRSFPLWCADHARHTIAHNFLNSYQNKSGDFCFYFSNKISGLICIWMIHRQIVVDHHFQEIIELIVRTHIGVHDACNIGFFSLSTHSVPFSRSQFGQ